MMMRDGIYGNALLSREKSWIVSAKLVEALWLVTELPANTAASCRSLYGP